MGRLPGSIYIGNILLARSFIDIAGVSDTHERRSFGIKVARLHRLRQVVSLSRIPLVSDKFTASSFCTYDSIHSGVF